MTPFVDLSDGNSDDRTVVRKFVVDDYRFHVMSDNNILVFKDIDDDHTYEISSEFGCNCPGATYRNKSCKHEKFAGFKRDEEESATSTNEGSALTSIEIDEISSLLD